MDTERVRAAIALIRTLLPAWMEFEANLPALRHDLDRMRGNETLAAASRSEAWASKLSQQTAEELNRYDKKWRDYGGLKGRIRRHNRQGKQLFEAQKLVCQFAHQARIDAESLKRLLEFHEWTQVQDALLVLGHVEDALADRPAEGGTGPTSARTGAVFSDETLLKQIREAVNQLGPKCGSNEVCKEVKGKRQTVLKYIAHLEQTEGLRIRKRRARR